MAILTLSKNDSIFSKWRFPSNLGSNASKTTISFRVSLENFGVTNTTTELTKQVVDVSRPKCKF